MALQGYTKDRNRKRISVSLPERMPPYAKTSPALICNKHQGDPITEFSLTYQKCMCLRCATAQHDNFSDFIPISACVKEKRDEASTLVDHIAEFAKIARSYRNDRRKFVENLKVAEGHIRGTIKKVKTSLNRHIDILENKLVSSLSKLVATENTGAKDTLTEFQVLEGQLNNLREHIHDVMKRGNDVELITTVVEEKKGFNKLRNEFDMPEDKVANKTLKFNMSPAISDFIDQVKDLGEIKFQTDTSILTSPDVKFLSLPSPSPVPRAMRIGSKLSHRTDSVSVSKTPVIRSTSVMRPTPTVRSKQNELFHRENGAVTMRRPNASEISYNLQMSDRFGTDASVVFTEEHYTTCGLTGVVGLESGLIAVCDAKHKCIQLLNRRSEILDDLVFHYTPCSLARVSDASFATSFTHKDFVSFFKVANYRLSHVKDIQIGGNGGSYSIAVSKNKIAVCRKGEIRIVSIDDSSNLQTIPIASSSPSIVMTDGGTKIFMADTRENKVICMSDLGKPIWQFVKGHMQPQGLALDLNQLFVADYRGRVFILSTYGDLVKEITCGGQLRAISTDPMSGNVLLTQESRDKTRSRAVKIVPI